MASSNKTLKIILGAVGGFLLLGCCAVAVLIGLHISAVQKADQNADKAQKLNNLFQIAKAIYDFYDARGRLPTKAEDLEAFVVFPWQLEPLCNGEISVIWDAVSFEREKRDTTNVILAWYTAPTPGGLRLVLFMDGAVEAITESDFQKRPKAQVVEKR